MNVLIVDDDFLIREDIKHLIDWEAQGYNLIMDVSNGREALEYIEKYQIDIILTDIQMPIMNGIELIKKVKEEHSYIQFLVMSNFDDFQYVKDSMKYGAFDYILKYKLDEIVLLTQLKAAKDDLLKKRKKENEIKFLKNLSQQKHSAVIENYWYRIFNNDSKAENMAKEYQELDLLLNNKKIVLLYIDLDNDSYRNIQIDNSFNHTFIHIGKNKWVLLLFFKEKSYLYLNSRIHEIIKNILDEIKKNNILNYSIIVGDVCCNAIDVITNFKNIKNGHCIRFYTKKNGIYYHYNLKDYNKQLDLSFVKEQTSNIINALYITEEQKTINLNIAFFSALEQRLYDIYELKNSLLDFYKDILDEIIKHGEVINRSQQLLEFKNKINSKYITIVDIKTEFNYLIKQFYSTKTEINQLKTGRPEIKKALDFINTSYKNDITLDDISNMVGLSKNYFCKLFKEETNENFINYLNSTRVRQAKNLLVYSNFKNKEIANEVGISNYRYFCKVFKQITGCKPQEYKRNNAQ